MYTVVLPSLTTLELLCSVVRVHLCTNCSNGLFVSAEVVFVYEGVSQSRSESWKMKEGGFIC